MTYDEIQVAAQRVHLTIFGCVPKDGGTIVLLGPDEPRYWPALTKGDEWNDGQPDPVDRWSARVIGSLATTLGAVAHFPFGDPPAPFLTWAMESDRAWQSPVGMLVQADAGLLVSYRGALEFDYVVNGPAADKPCETCQRPCETACPVAALTTNGYDTDRCKAHITSAAGADCLNGGCLVRRACPVSQGWPRIAQHSAYHMKEFL